MTKDELITLATRSEDFTDEEISSIEQQLLDATAEDAYDVLIKVNATNDDPQKTLMVKLSSNETLYEKISEFVKSKEETEDESDS